MPQQLTPHFTVEELTHSQDATRLPIDNTPPPDILVALKRTAEGMERVRAVIGGPILVSSGYRSQRLNKRIGGAPGSQHVRGEAVDFSHPTLHVTEVAELIKANKDKIGYDQLILEYPERNGWVHISFSSKARGVELTKKGNVNGYIQGLVA